MERREKLTKEELSGYQSWIKTDPKLPNNYDSYSSYYADMIHNSIMPPETMVVSVVENIVEEKKMVVTKITRVGVAALWKVFDETGAEVEEFKGRLKALKEKYGIKKLKKISKGSREYSVKQ